MQQCGENYPDMLKLKSTEVHVLTNCARTPDTAKIKEGERNPKGPMMSRVSTVLTFVSYLTKFLSKLKRPHAIRISTGTNVQFQYFLK